MIAAAVVADSISPQGIRLLTFKLRYPWFIHGEVMTHRVLSRNASSNRAIPLKKMLEEVRSDTLRAEPVYWGAEQKGMEPGGELDDTDKFMKWINKSGEQWFIGRKEATQRTWRAAAMDAAKRAEEMAGFGLHKSLCNRLLMPFTHANVIISGTEWDNFFGLRLAKDADPTMRALAEAMWVAMNGRIPQKLQPGQWHLPFVDQFNEPGLKPFDESKDNPLESDYVKVSVARCARISYESHDTGKRSTVTEDLALYDRLLGGLSDKTKPLHASPAEHQATPDTPGGVISPRAPVTWAYIEQHGNLIGWRQYRKMLPGEDKAPLPEGYRK